MGNDKIFVVIPVFNRIRYIEKCLQLLQIQTYKNTEIIVVDDNSTDGTKELIIEKFPTVKILMGDGQLYWTGSMVLGIGYVLERAKKTDYVLVLNDDLIFEDNLIENLYIISQNNPKSLIQALGSWIEKKDKIQYAGKKMKWWTAKGVFLHLNDNISDFPNDYIERSGTLTGRGVLIPVQAFVDVGNYDKRYQQSGDPEFSIRAAKAGYSLLVAFKAIVYNYSPIGKGNINERKILYLRDIKEYYFGVLSQARIKTLYLNATSYGNNFLQSIWIFIYHFLGLTWRFIKRLKLFKRKL